MTLLEKIEELVLYTLEQQKTIEALQARLKALETTPKADQHLETISKPLSCHSERPQGAEESRR